jgi:hypothetical protein
MLISSLLWPFERGRQRLRFMAWWAGPWMLIYARDLLKWPARAFIAASD